MLFEINLLRFLRPTPLRHHFAAGDGRGQGDRRRSMLQSDPDLTQTAVEIRMINFFTHNGHSLARNMLILCKHEIIGPEMRCMTLLLAM
jgi:hypothetical protein